MPNYSATAISSILKFFFLGRHVKISGALCILSVTLMEFNCFRRKKCVLERMESLSAISFTCCPTALPVQHARTQKKRFPCLVFGARISDLPSKYGKSSIASEFGDGKVQVHPDLKRFPVKTSL